MIKEYYPLQFELAYKKTCYINDGLHNDEQKVEALTPRDYLPFRLVYVNHASSLEGLNERNRVVDGAIFKAKRG